MITKEKKKEIISSLESAVKNSKSVVFVNFHGLSVSEASKLRRSLRAHNVLYKVAKKTLIKRALASGKVAGELPPLEGELALAYLSGEALAKSDGEDSLAPARNVYEFEKKLEGKVSILGGIFEGKYMSKADIIGIALIPSAQVLRGMFVNIINSPIQRFVIALNKVAEKKL